MRVNLSYFRLGGKWYSDATYDSPLPAGTPIYKLWNEIRDMVSVRQLPGLIAGHGHVFVLVDVPDHPHNYPVLLMTELMHEIGNAVERLT